MQPNQFNQQIYSFSLKTIISESLTLQPMLRLSSNLAPKAPMQEACATTDPKKPKVGSQSAPQDTACTLATRFFWHLLAQLSSITL